MAHSRLSEGGNLNENIQTKQHEMEILTFASCTTFILKNIIQHKARIPIKDQVLSSAGVTMEDNAMLYQCKLSARESGSTGGGGDVIPEFDLSLVVIKKRVVPPLRLDLSNKLPAAASSSGSGNEFHKPNSMS